MGVRSVFEYCFAFYKNKLDCISEAQSKSLFALLLENTKTKTNRISRYIVSYVHWLRGYLRYNIF